MGKFKRSTFWGVHIVSLSLFALFALSFGWVIRHSHTGSYHGQPSQATRHTLWLSDGRLAILRYPVRDQKYPVLDGRDIPIDELLLFMGVRRVWDISGLISYHDNTRWKIELPLVYPMLAISLLSGWLLLGSTRSRQRTGACKHCGYSLEGLASSTCPECGVERG